MNQYDPRINNEHCIRAPFTVDTAKQYIGKRGYFTDDLFNFSNLDSCCDGMLVSVESDNRHPYYCGISDEGVIIKGNFSFFLSAEFVEEKSKEQKYRPFTLEEFNERFEFGEYITFRLKDKTRYFCTPYNGNEYRSETEDDPVDDGVHLGAYSFSLLELFNNYELQAEDDWLPFGVEE